MPIYVQNSGNVDYYGLGEGNPNYYSLHFVKIR